MDERSMVAAVAERATLAKEEAADLIRATMDQLGRQLSGGELRELSVDLPDGLADHMPQHDRGAHPVALNDFVRQLVQRTGLNEAEVRRGLRAILIMLDRGPGSSHLRHALSQLPAEYRQLITAGQPGAR
jgi:uncharacterized protein (DUF2267 family)